MTHFEIASSINTLMMMAGNDANGEPKTNSQFMNSNSIDIALDFAVETIINLLPPHDKKHVMALLTDDGKESAGGYLA